MHWLSATITNEKWIMICLSSHDTHLEPQAKQNQLIQYTVVFLVTKKLKSLTFWKWDS